MSNRRISVKNAAAWNILNQASMAVFGVIQYSILARILDRSDFGLLAIATTLTSLVLLFQDMGLSGAVLTKGDLTSEEYSTLYWLNVGLSFVASLVIVFGAPWIAAFYGSVELIEVLLGVASSVLLTAFGRQAGAMASRDLDFKLIALAGCLSTLISFVVSIALALMGAGVQSLVYGVVLKVGLKSLFMMLMSSERGLLHFVFEFGKIRGLFNIGLYGFIGQILNMMKSHMDGLLIAKFVGLDAAGIYDLGKRLSARPFNILNPVVMNVGRPYMAREIRDGRSGGDAVVLTTRMVSSLNSPVYFLLVVFNVQFVVAMYGKSNAVVADIFLPMCLYHLLRSLMNPVSALAMASGRTLRECIWHIATFPLTPIVVYFSGRFGGVGVAWGMLSLFVVILPLFWRFLVWPFTGIAFLDYLKSFRPLSISVIYNMLRNRSKNKL